MLDFPRQVAGAANDDVAPAFQALELIVSPIGHVGPAHRHRVTKQDVRLVLVAGDGVDLRTLLGGEAHHVDAEPRH